MSLYHINPKTGNPGVCHAKDGNCPHGGSAAEHFTSKEAAREAYEKNNVAFASSQVKPADNWTATEFKKGLRSGGIAGYGRNLEEASKTIRELYEHVAKTPVMSNDDVVKRYLKRSPDWNSDNIYVHVSEYHGGRVSISIDSDSPDTPFEFTGDYGDLIEHDVSQSEYDWNDSYTHEYTIKPDTAHLNDILDNKQAEKLKNSYDYLNNPNYPDWMILGNAAKRSEIQTLSPIQAAREVREARKAVAKEKAAADAAAAAGRRMGSQTAKLQELTEYQAELQDALKAARTKTMENTLKKSAAETADTIQKINQSEATKARKASVQNKSAIAKRLKDAQEQEAEAMKSLRKEAESMAVSRLAARHPASNGNTAKAEARKWVKEHPALVDEIIQERRQDWQ